MTNPTEGDPNDEPKAAKEKVSKTVTCEFCECPISVDSGEWKKLSDKAKAFRTLQERYDQKCTDLSDLQSRFDALRAEHAECGKVAPAGDPAPRKKGLEIL